jgi:hypothetical protein
VPELCLVPTPLAAARAARRLCDAQGGILFGTQVTTLERLAPGLLAAAGDRRAVLAPLAERLLAVEAGRAAGGPLAGLAPDGGLAAALAAALSELRRGEVRPAEAREAAAELERGAAARLQALADALEAFEDALGRLGVLDRAGAMRAAADAARRGGSSPEIAGLDVLVLSGVFAAPPAGWDLLAALVGRARRTFAHLPFFPERPDMCAPVEPLLRRIEALHEVAVRREIDVVLPSVDGGGRAPRMSALLAAFASGGALAAAERSRAAEASTNPGIVVAEAAAGERGEPEAAAHAIASLLDAGFAPGDVVVIAPSPRRAASGLARACAAAGIPFAAGRGLRLADAPPVRAVLDVLASAGGLDRSAAERLAASTYLSPTGGSALRSLLDRAGALDGRAPPATALRRRASALAAPAASRERGALERAAAQIDALETMMRPLASHATAREHAARVGALLGVSGLRRRAARAPRDVAARDLAALAALDETMEALSRAVALAGRGAERLAPGELHALTALAVEEASLPPDPEPAAGAVELWGLDEAPGLTARAAVLVGCVRGAWPAALLPDPLLREPERQAIRRRLGRPAVATGGQRRAEAAFHAFSAAAAGREAVAFLWAGPGPVGDGGPIAPVVADALAALGIAPREAAAADPALARSRTEREALRAAARAGPRSLAALAGGPLAARAADALARAAIEERRREAVNARRPGPYAGAIAGPAASALEGALPHEWAPTLLEKWARCPFRLFLEIGLKLDEPAGEALDIDVRDEGSLLHAVLERFVRARVERGSWPPAGSDADLAEARSTAEDVAARFEREGRTGDPAVFAARRRAVIGRIERFVRSEARDAGGLAPALLEHSFGGRSGRPALEVSSGGEVVRLRGRIDRVDAGPDRLLVLDYKNGKDASAYAELLDPAAFGETSFQIPTYLVAAARDLPGRARMSATYALLRTGERLAPAEIDAADPLLAADAGTGRGGAARPFAASVVDAVRRIRRGEFPIASRSCERCPFGAVCRFEGVAARTEAGA